MASAALYSPSTCARAAMVGIADSRDPMVVRGRVGTGKTTFALRFAHQLTAEFPDCQLFADMSARHADDTAPREVITGFLHALGVPRDQVPDDDMHIVAQDRPLQSADAHLMGGAPGFKLCLGLVR
ncbi:hypothetical protein [Nocardia sp. NBC_00403]|uniref:hypothetical protein n=1 Tax=Nocardia sp. NBC_00403 TaxID=2975990 RepID=UPI002E212180